ncbi:MAG: hypothetical protein PF481_07725 [Bacteroidales bacterium]|nr:hypothetical protein [Bacteroidales bacterium]
MEANTKKALGTLAVVAAIGGGFYLIKKGKKLLAGAKMNFALLGFRIHKMNLQEVKFAVKLRCYNPSKAPITLVINQIVANYKDSAIAYSTPDIKGLTIEPGKTQEPEIMFDIPYLNLVGKGLNLTTLSNTEQLKKDLTFTMTLSINGETITTTQSLTDAGTAGFDTKTNASNQNYSLPNSSQSSIKSTPIMNGLALGELGIVSGPRNTKNGKRFNHLIKRANGQDTFIKNGNVLETVENCIDIIGSHYREVESLAKMLKVGEVTEPAEVKDTCRNIFNFSYNYLQYHKDDDGTEQLRTPSRSWVDGQIKFKQKAKSNAGIDCDDFSIFVGSLLKNLGIPFKLRITKYDGKKNFQHIYVIVPAVGDSEDEIVIDPVLSKFDYQKPYSFERSDFDMSPLQLAGLRGINGLTGTSALGLPISMLSGIDLAGGIQAQGDHEELIAIVSGVDFDDAINGLGDADDATYKYLVRTRDFLLKNKNNKNKMAQVQNPDQFISMLDQAIKFWNTPERDAVLDKLSDIEEKLAENGLIKYDSEAIQGLSELDELDEMDGLGRKKRSKGRFFKALKKVGGKVKNHAKKVVKAIVRYNPLSIAIRGGLLAALRLNIFKISKKLQYAYLPDNLASKYNIDPTQHAKLKKVHAKIKKLFKGLQGKEENLRKAILKGAKQKSSDFSIKGLHGLIGELQALEAIGELAELGNLGVVATAASVTAASGVLAKIGSWLKPIKNIFSKVKGKLPKFKKAKNTISQFAPSGSNTPQANNRIPQTSNFTQQSAYAPQPTQTNFSNPNITGGASKKKLSKGAKVGIGIGIAAILGTGAYFVFRNKDDDKQKNKSSNRKSSEKKSLGSIQLQ